VNVSLKKLTDALTRLQSQINALSASAGVLSIVAGAGITVDATNPQHPVVSLTALIPKFWRVYITANNGNAVAAVDEIEMSAAAGGANIAMGGTPFASSSLSGWPPSQAFDGINVDPGWASNSGTAFPQYVGTKLATATKVNSIKIHARNEATAAPSQAPQAFTIQSSLDSTTGLDGTWTNEWSVTGQTGWAVGETRTFTRP